MTNVVNIKVGVSPHGNFVKVRRYQRGHGLQQNCLRVYQNVSRSSLRRVLHAQWKLSRA